MGLRDLLCLMHLLKLLFVSLILIYLYLYVKIITHRIGNRLRQSGSGLAGINLRDYGIERKF